MHASTPDEIVHAAYTLLLNRDPEPAGLRHWAHALENGLPKAELVRAVLASREFRQTMMAVEDLVIGGRVARGSFSCVR